MGQMAAITKTLCSCQIVRVWSDLDETPPSQTLLRKTVDFFLWDVGEVLLQAKKLKYLGVLLTSGAKTGIRWTGSLSGLFCWKGIWVASQTLLIYQLIYVPTVTYGHELWVVIERMWIKAERISLSIYIKHHSIGQEK